MILFLLLIPNLHHTISLNQILIHQHKVDMAPSHRQLNNMHYNEYDEFKKRISNQLSPVEIDFIENFEKEQKKLRGK